MIDQAFFEEPRIIMGLNPRHREVLRPTKADEERHFRGASLGDEKVPSITHVEGKD